MAFWVNLCIILLGSAFHRCYCRQSSDISHITRAPRRVALRISRSDSEVATADRFIRSKSQRTKQVADLMMIMDISTSLNESDREYQRQALRSLSKSKLISIGKNNVRIGIVAFETWTHMILPLDKGISRTAIYDAAAQVDMHKFRKNGSGFTNFPDAMDMAKKQLANGRNNTVKAAVLVTDGGENCAPSQVFLNKPCSRGLDCHYIAANCSRPPPGKDLCDCHRYKYLPCTIKSAVFGEFAQLRKAGGWQVTLAIIGVGDKITRYSRERLRCWATERMYQEVPSYSELEKTIENLVTTVLPADPRDDCQFTRYSDKGCHMDHNTCGYYSYINITRNQTPYGRPCPPDEKWEICAYSACGVSFGPGDYAPVTEVVRATKGSNDHGGGIGWWLIFIILLASLAAILCVAIVLVAAIRKRRARRAVTTGVQPSVIEPITVRTASQTTTKSMGSAFAGGLETTSKPSVPGVGQGVQQSPLSISRSVQPNSRLVEETSQRKIAVMDESHKAPVSRPVSSQTAQERDTSAQPGKSLTPSSVTMWKSPSKVAFKKTAFDRL